MPICGDCKIRENREVVRSGSKADAPESKAYHERGWHNESFWHREAAFGHDIPKERVKR